MIVSSDHLFQKNLRIVERKKRRKREKEKKYWGEKERKTERGTKKRAVLRSFSLKVETINEPQKYRRKLDGLTGNSLPFFFIPPLSSFSPSPPPPPLLFFQRTIPKGWLISRRLLVLAASAYCSAFPRISSSSYAAHEMEHEADVAPRQSFPLSSSSLLLTFLRSYNKTGTLVYLISRLPFHDEPRDRFIHPPPCRRDYPCSSCFETSGLVHFYRCAFLFDEWISISNWFIFE